MRNWSQMPGRLGRECGCCSFPAFRVHVHHLASLSEYFSTNSKLFAQLPGFGCIQPEVQLLPTLPYALVQLFFSPSSCTDSTYQCPLSIRSLPCPDPHDEWPSVRCPWYLPHLRSLCTSCFMNFLSSPGDSQNVLSSSHLTLIPFLICRYFPQHYPVLFSPFTPRLPQRLLLPDTQQQSSPAPASS